MVQQNCCKIIIEVHSTVHLLHSNIPGLTTNACTTLLVVAHFGGFKGDPIRVDHRKYVVKFPLCRLGQPGTKCIPW